MAKYNPGYKIMSNLITLDSDKLPIANRIYVDRNGANPGAGTVAYYTGIDRYGYDQSAKGFGQFLGLSDDWVKNINDDLSLYNYLQLARAKRVRLTKFPSFADSTQPQVGTNIVGIVIGEDAVDEESPAATLWIQYSKAGPSSQDSISARFNYKDNIPSFGIMLYFAYNGDFQNGTYYHDSEMLISIVELYDDDGTWAHLLFTFTKHIITSPRGSTTEGSKLMYPILFGNQGWFSSYGVNWYNSGEGGMATDPNTQVPWGTNEPDGGNGDFDFSSDPVDKVDITSTEFVNFTATAAGFVTLYQPSAAQLQIIAQDLYNLMDDLLKIYGNWTEIIVGLGILPVRPITSGYKQPMVGNQKLTALQVVSSQYYELDCGTIEVAECYGSYLDYNPYTKISIYLPYIGVKELDVDEVMASQLTVTYYIDCYNGNCVANIEVQKEGIPKSVRYCFSGNCMQAIPVNAQNWDAIIQAGVTLATAAVGGAVAGAGIAAAGEAGAASALNTGQAALGTGNAIQSNAATIQYGANQAKTSVNLAQNANKTASAGVGAVMSAKMIPQRSGSLGQSAGMMSPQVPYIIRTIPKISLPEYYAHFKGYPSNVYVSALGSLEGYTEVESVVLNNLAATEPEVEEIYNLLKGGIYI